MSTSDNIKTCSDGEVTGVLSAEDGENTNHESCVSSTNCCALRELNTKLVAEIAVLRETLENVKAPAKVKNLYQQLFRKKKQLEKARESIVRLENKNEILIEENNRLHAKSLQSELEKYVKELKEENEDLRKQLMDVQPKNKTDDPKLQNNAELESLYLAETDAIIDEFERDYSDLKAKYAKLLEEMENVNFKNRNLLERIHQEEEKSSSIQEKYSNLLQEVETEKNSSHQKYTVLQNQCTNITAELETIVHEMIKANTLQNVEEHKKLFFNFLQGIQQITVKFKQICMADIDGLASENNVLELVKSINELKILNEQLINENLEKATQVAANDTIIQDLKENLSDIKLKYENLYVEMEIISQDNERLNTSLSDQNTVCENSDHGIQSQQYQANELQDQIIKLNTELLDCKQYCSNLQEDISQLRAEMKCKNEKIDSLMLLQLENLQLQAECKSMRRKYEELKKVVDEIQMIHNEDDHKKFITSVDEYQRLKHDYDELVVMYQSSNEEISKIKRSIRWYEMQLSEKKTFLARQSQELQNTLADLKLLESFIMNDTKILDQNSIIEDITEENIHEIVEEHNIMIANENRTNKEPDSTPLQCLSTAEDEAENLPDSPTFIKLFLKKNEKFDQEEQDGGGGGVSPHGADKEDSNVFKLVTPQDKEDRQDGCCESDQYQGSDMGLVLPNHKIQRQALNGTFSSRSEDEYLKSLKGLKEDLDQLRKSSKEKEDLVNSLVTRQQQYEQQIVENNDKIEYFKNELKRSLQRMDNLKSIGRSNEMDLIFQKTEEKYIARMRAKEQELKNLREQLKELAETNIASRKDETNANTLCDLLAKLTEMENINEELKTERETLNERLEQNLEEIQRHEAMKMQYDKQKKMNEMCIQDLKRKVIVLEENEAKAHKHQSSIEKELQAMTEEVQKLMTDKEEMRQNEQNDLQDQIDILTGKLADGKRRHQAEMEYLQLVLENRSEEVDSLQQTVKEKNDLIKKLKRQTLDYEEIMMKQKSEINKNAMQKEELRMDFDSLLKKYETLKTDIETQKRNPIRESEIILKSNRIVQFNDDTVLNRYSFVDLPSPVDGTEFDYMQLYNKFEEACKVTCSTTDSYGTMKTSCCKEDEKVFSNNNADVLSPEQNTSSVAFDKNVKSKSIDVYRIEFESVDDKSKDNEAEVKEKPIAYVVTGYNQEKGTFILPNLTAKQFCSTDTKLLTDKEAMIQMENQEFYPQYEEQPSKCVTLKEQLHQQAIVLNKKDMLLEKSKDTIDRICTMMEAQRGLSLCAEKRLYNLQSDLNNHLMQIESQRKMIQDLEQKLQLKQDAIDELESSVDFLKKDGLHNLKSNLQELCRREEILKLQTINMRLQQDKKILESKVSFLDSWNIKATRHVDEKREEQSKKDQIKSCHDEVKCQSQQIGVLKAVTDPDEIKLSKYTNRVFYNEHTDEKTGNNGSSSVITSSYLISVLKAERETLCRSVTHENNLNSLLTKTLLDTEKKLQTALQHGHLNDPNGIVTHDFRLVMRDLEIKRLREFIKAKYVDKMTSRRKNWINRKKTEKKK